MIAHEHPVVRRVDHHRVLREPLLVEEVEKAPDVLVHRRHHAHVVLHVLLIHPVVQLVASELFRRVELAEVAPAVPAQQQLWDEAGVRRLHGFSAARQVIVEGGRLRDLLV